MRLYLALAAALALAACATPTPYQPAQSGREGYTERRIENDRFMISFQGNSLTERNTVEAYLLYRAAELTLDSGYDYFMVLNRDVDQKSRYLSSGGTSYPGFRPSYYWYHPRRGWYPYFDPFWDDTTYREVTAYEARAEVVMRRGAKPDNDPQAFDARQVKQNLEGQIRRPE
jgi:hypothetical protein